MADLEDALAHRNAGQRDEADQYEISMLAWFSEGFAGAMGTDVAYLRSRTGIPYSHDNLFHFIIGLLDIETAYYLGERDLFHDCRRL